MPHTPESRQGLSSCLQLDALGQLHWLHWWWSSPALSSNRWLGSDDLTCVAGKQCWWSLPAPVSPVSPDLRLSEPAEWGEAGEADMTSWARRPCQQQQQPLHPANLTIWQPEITDHTLLSTLRSHNQLSSLFRTFLSTSKLGVSLSKQSDTIFRELIKTHSAEDEPMMT